MRDDDKLLKKPKRKRRVGPKADCWQCAGTGVVRAYNARKTVKCGECAPQERRYV